MSRLRISPTASCDAWLRRSRRRPCEVDAVSGGAASVQRCTQDGLWNIYTTRRLLSLRWALLSPLCGEGQRLGETSPPLLPMVQSTTASSQ